MTDHGARAHATWSASASDRLWACPGSLALTAGLRDKESEAAAWGTACHQISEKCLRGGKDAIEFLGTTETTKEHSFVVDEEMAETAQVYVDYVRLATTKALVASVEALKSLADAHTLPKSTDEVLLIEQKFSLAKINPPFDAGGTGDAVILDRTNKLIEIVDLKGGRGVVVEAVGNKQLRTYALGAVLANPGDWRTVRVTIVQPRAPHPDGRIRSEEFDVIDLFDWTVDLQEAMKRAKQAGLDSFQKHGSGLQSFDAKWAADYLKAGDHCLFCKAKPTCPALQTKALAEAHTHFKPEGGMAQPPAPQTLTMDQMVRVLDHADMIQNWLNAVRAYAQDQAEMGVDVAAGDSVYVLTPKRATRKWQGDEEQILAALQARTDRDLSEFLNEPKMMSPAQVEKVLGKKGFAAVADLAAAESSGFNLTRSDKTTRGAVAAPAKTFFQPIEQE